MGYCTYCNYEIGGDRDHVVLRAWTGNQTKTGHPIVDCCRDCNNMLGSVPIHTVPERAAYLYTKYYTKYKKRLNADAWTKEELKEMSPTMKRYIVLKQREVDGVRQRLQNLAELADTWLT